MNNIKSYPKYKDSEVPWVGDIPSGWEMRKLKHIFSEKKITHNPDLPCGAISFGKVVEKPDEKIPFSTKASYQVLNRGEFLVNPLNLNYDVRSLRIGLSEIDVVVSSGYIVLKSNEENKRYLNYMMHRYDVAHMKLLGSGVRQTINYNHISDSLLPIPSKPEQIAIANFLDDKVGRIDEAIAQKERLIQLLNERKQIIIQNAVTKGLNPNAPMRDSGIEWIGKIPEHWEVAPLYSRCEVRLGKMLDSKKITGKKLGKYLRNIDVQWFRINTDNLPLMDFEKGEYARYGLKSGDLLVCEGGEPGRCAVWNYETPCYYQKALHRIRPKRGDLPLFIALQLRNAVENAAFSMAGKATIAHLTGEQLRPFRMLFPSVLEQNDIINHVQQKCDRIGRSIQHQINIIEQLKEYKATLINSAVTGKINVSNYGL